MTGAGIPDGVAVETIFIVEISYEDDAADKRPAVRPEHLTRVARLMQEGRLIEAGGYLDLSSALLWVRAPSEEEAVALVRDDVYIREGVWRDDARARPFGRVVLTSGPGGRDGPRTQGLQEPDRPAARGR
jgi:uncharacterized protein YciI